MAKKLSDLEPSQQLIVVLNQLGLATEHLAKGVEAVIVYLRESQAAGRDPGSVIQSATDAINTIFGRSEKKRRRGG